MQEMPYKEPNLLRHALASSARRCPRHMYRSGYWRHMEDDPMNPRWHARASLTLVLVATMLFSLAQLGRVAAAQDATPASAPAATPVPWAQTWQVLVNNVSPEG